MAAHLVRRLLTQFVRNRAGNVAQLFGLAILPVIFAAGAAVDYTTASDKRTKLQAALDEAVLAGAKDGRSSWKTIAQSAFAAGHGSGDGANFTGPSSGVYSGTASGSVETAFVRIGLQGDRHPGQREGGCGHQG